MLWFWLTISYVLISEEDCLRYKELCVGSTVTIDINTLFMVRPYT